MPFGDELLREKLARPRRPEPTEILRATLQESDKGSLEARVYFPRPVPFAPISECAETTGPETFRNVDHRRARDFEHPFDRRARVAAA
jgi:hypothetical protein